jgi:hypothetical protein
MKFLDDGIISGLLPAETASFPAPVPTQIVSSDEYLPVPQTAQQKEVEMRLIEMTGCCSRTRRLHQPLGERADGVAVARRSYGWNLVTA